MPDYKAPLRDMRFVLNEVLDIDGHYQGLGLEEVNSELLNAFLEEGAKFKGMIDMEPGAASSSSIDKGKGPKVVEPTKEDDRAAKTA